MKAPRIISKRGPRVTPDEHRLIVKQARACLRELSKVAYELPPMTRPLTVQTKQTSGRCTGGRNRIVIDVWWLRESGGNLTEYRSIGNSRVIGNFHADPEVVMFAIVAHEVAHHVHRAYSSCAPWYSDSKPHGPTWRYIYSWLRRELVNPLVRIEP